METFVTAATTTIPAPRSGGSVEALDLQYARTVDRSLVHRASVAEVFATDSAHLRDDHFLVAAQLPRGHSMVEAGAHYDFNLLVEVVRQAGVLVAHEYLDIPLDAAFAFRSLRIDLTDLDATRIDAHPAAALVDLRARITRTPKGKAVSMEFEGGVALDGNRVLDGHGSLVLLSKASWKGVRARGRRIALENAPLIRVNNRAASPDSVGRRGSSNVVVSQVRTHERNVAEARLLVNTAHPFMFDHPLDHVPGNLVVEAARQVAVAAVSATHHVDAYSLVPSACQISFDGFLELDLATELRAEVSDLASDVTGRGHCAVEVTVAQAGRVAATCRLRVDAL